jgi:hypothetical protein
MTLETLVIIIVFCLFCCYLVYRWQSAVVDSVVPPAPEPYPVPLDEPEPVQLNPQAAWPFPTSQKP